MRLSHVLLSSPTHDPKRPWSGGVSALQFVSEFSAQDGYDIELKGMIVAITHKASSRTAAVPFTSVRASEALPEPTQLAETILQSSPGKRKR